MMAVLCTWKSTFPTAEGESRGSKSRAATNDGDSKYKCCQKEKNIAQCDPKNGQYVEKAKMAVREKTRPCHRRRDPGSNSRASTTRGDLKHEYVEG